MIVQESRHKNGVGRLKVTLTEYMILNNFCFELKYGKLALTFGHEQKIKVGHKYVLINDCK